MNVFYVRAVGVGEIAWRLRKANIRCRTRLDRERIKQSE